MRRFGRLTINKVLVGSGLVLILPTSYLLLSTFLYADDKPDIAKLIQQLGSDDWQKRESAQKELEEIGEPAEPALNEASKSNDVEIRMRAKYILKTIPVKKRVKFSDSLLKEFPNLYHDLATLGTPGKFELLLPITTRDGEKKEYKYKGKVTDKDIALFISEILLENGVGLNYDQKMVLLAICRGCVDHYEWREENKKMSISVGWYRPIPGSAPSLRKLLKDESAEIRHSAIQVLGELDDKESIPEIRKFLKDKSADARRSAIVALRHLDDKESLPEIGEFLKDESAEVRISAFGSLLRWLSWKEVLPEIRELLKDESADIRRSAMSALINLAGDEAIPEIRKLLKDESAVVRGLAIHSLDALRDKEAIPEIRKLLKDESEDVRRLAIDVLSSFGDKEAIPEIRKLLKDKSAYVRWLAIRALSSFGDKESIPEIRELQLLKDEDETVRAWAAIALLELEEKSDIPREVIKDITSILKRLNKSDQQRAEKALKALDVSDEEIEKAK